MKQIILVCSMSLISCTLNATIVSVPADQPTVQAGINAASTGDTVLIAIGTYVEHVSIGIPLTLLGEDRNGTVLDGAGLGHVVEVTANRVHVEKLTVQNAGPLWDYEFYWDSGILFNACDSCLVVDCRLIDNPAAGISQWGAQFNKYEQCEIVGGRAGFYFFEDWNGPYRPNLHNEIRSCSIEGTSEAGILFEHVVAYHHESNVIFGNLISNCGTGFGAIMAQSNQISYNSFVDNSYGVGITVCMAGGNSNICHHNNFINCGARDSDGGEPDAVDFWNLSDPCEGNYWSEYTGVDADSDGIGDTPYPIGGDAGTFDYCPLMQPVSLPVDCVGIRGNIDGDPQEEINIADLVYLVNYMFNGGPAPNLPLEADIDGNGTGPDIADLVYLVNYMFNGGPAPAACP
ncbi:MAG: NosD domain-containing protein [bacterium]